MISMAIIVATKGWEQWRRCVDSWNKTARDYHEIIPVRGMQVLEAYQLGYIQAEKHAEVIGFLHDDLVIFEQGWDKRVLKEFEDPAVGMVGFGGGLGHGRPELYRVPYHLPDLARQNFMSNMKQAEVHGERFKGVRDVAVLDGFALFVRTEILRKVGGWPVNTPIGFYMYSEWLCCEARRQHYRIRLVGVECDHIGGRTSTLAAVQDNYEEAHRYFYEHNKDVMPYRVNE